MGIFLVMVGSVALTYGCIKFALSAFKQAINMSISGYSSSKMIGDGSAEKAKILDKKPVDGDESQDINVSAGNNKSQIPNMRGVDNPNGNEIENGQRIDKVTANQQHIAGNKNISNSEDVDMIIITENSPTVQNNDVEQRRNITGPVFMGNDQVRVFTLKKGDNQLDAENIYQTNRENITLQQNGEIVEQNGDSSIEMTNSLKGVPNNVMNFYNNNLQSISNSSLQNNETSSGLNNTELVKLLEVYRLQSGNNFTEIQKNESIYKQIIRTAPNLTPSQIVSVANKVIQMNNDNRSSKEIMANFMTNSQYNLNEENMNSLDGILRDNSSIAEKFDGFVDENYKKELEERAKHNIEERENMTLEEKEKERDEFIKRIKNEVLEDPDGASNMIGNEGVNLLKGELSSNTQNYNNIYKEKLRELENLADIEYAKNNGIQGSDLNSLREERIKNDLKEYINEALKSMNKTTKSWDVEKKRHEQIYVERENLIKQNAGGQANNAINQIHYA